MAAALTILAKQRGDVTFVHQSLYYPVTDAAQDTDSYREFADGPFLTAKRWPGSGTPTCRTGPRAEITASPLRATLDDLAGLPEAFVIVDENDVLRDEGEAYARKLTAAGVRTTCVRFNGAIHDFMMLNPLRGTAATSAAVEQAVHVLRKALGTPAEPCPRRTLFSTTTDPENQQEKKPCPTTPTVVLVHGAFAESASWNAVIERLPPGHRGPSPSSSPPPTPCASSPATPPTCAT